MRWLALLFGVILGLGPARGARAAGSYITVSSPQIAVFAEANQFWYSVRTAGGQQLLYFQDGIPGTSHLVFDLNGSPQDMEATIVPGDVVQAPTASGSGLGANIRMVRRYGNLSYGSQWTIVADPHSGVGANTVQIHSWVTNNGPLPASVGLRVELDVQLGVHDDAPLSIDDGLTAFDRNTLIEGVSAPVPSDWWTYDAFPAASLIARGVTWGNQFGAPASQPDAIEFCHWDEVQGLAFYSPHPEPGRLFSSYTRPDTAVVLWYTNTGQAQGGAYTVPAGKTYDWVTYYGLQSEPLGQTPTPYTTFTATPTTTRTPTISPTHSITPTFSVSPTISPTHSITPTFSISPTYSVSPTISQTFTITQTYSFSPTYTPTPTVTPTATITPTFSFSQTYTMTPTFTVTPTFSVSPTFSATPTISPTHSISPTFTQTRSPTVSPTFSATPPPDLILTPKPPNPNPAGGDGSWLPYVLSRDATVNIRIFTVSGERVRDLEPFDGKWGANEEFWDLRNNAEARCGSGIFIVHIVATADGQQDDAWEKVAVLR